jgi:hypothetical protein
MHSSMAAMAAIYSTLSRRVLIMTDKTGRPQQTPADFQCL